METAIGGEETAVQPVESEMKTVDNGEETAEKKRAMKIRIDVDESERSFYALEWALQRIFKHHDATDKESGFNVTVVHVQPPFQPTYTPLSIGSVLFASSGSRESVVKAEEESAAKVLAHASELCDQHKIKTEYLVLKGKPKEILVEAVDQIDIDLLVVGSRGLGQIKSCLPRMSIHVLYGMIKKKQFKAQMEEEITGETSNGGERRPTAEQPPLTAERSVKKSLKVMVAIDESDESLYALKWTLEHLFNNPPGEETRDAEPDPEQGMVTVVHVVQPFERYLFPAEPLMYTSATMVDSVRKAQMENAAQLLSRAFQLCKGTKIKAETLILEGDAKEMICQAVEEMHFDLLVVGSRGLGAIKRALLGSISDFCAHHARCPILVVKPPHK